MAIMITTQEEKQSSEWMGVVIELLEDEGLGNTSLYDIIQEFWIQPLQTMGQVAQSIQTIQPELREMIQGVVEGGVWDRMELRRIFCRYFSSKDSVTGIEYTLYFNTRTHEFTTTPEPLETVLLYEESDFDLANKASRDLLLGQAMYQYMLDLSKLSRRRVEEEVMKRILRRTHSAWKQRTLQDIEGMDPVALLERLESGEVLASDLIPTNDKDYNVAYLKFYQEYYAERYDESEVLSLMEGPMLQAIDHLQGDFKAFRSLVDQLDFYHHRGFFRGLLIPMYQLYMESADLDELLEYAFYDISRDGTRSLKTLRFADRHTHGILNAISDELFEELLTQYIQAATSQTVDFPVATKGRHYFALSMRSLLHEERSQAYLKIDGSVYTNHESYAPEYVTYYKEYSLETFMRRGDGGFQYSAKITYINDAVYEDIVQLRQILSELPQDGVGIRPELTTGDRHFQYLRPVSELESHLEDLPITAEDFSNETGFAYIPGITQGTPAFMDEPIVYKPN